MPLWQEAAEEALQEEEDRYMEEQQESEAQKALQIAQEQERYKAEAEAVAKVLYGTALHNSREAQEAVVWCIINRTESSLFPDSILIFRMDILASLVTEVTGIQHFVIGL